MFECVYGELHGLIRKNIKSGHFEMVLKYCAVSTLPHHRMTYSWGTQHKGRPSPQCCCWLPPHRDLSQESTGDFQGSNFHCTYSNCTHFARLLKNKILVIVKNIHQSKQLSNNSSVVFRTCFAQSIFVQLELVQKLLSLFL